VILTHYDSLHGSLSAETRVALSNMWALQEKTGEQKGTWAWLQFNQEPWEANDSAYYGAALAAIAVGTAPDNYISDPEIQPNLKLLREYLAGQSAAQSTINRVFLLWASSRLPGLLSPVQQKAIVDEVRGRQQSDGGWRLASIAWRWSGWSPKSLLNMWLREDGTPLTGKSDGVATGLITYVFEEIGVSREDPSLKRGLQWLSSHQNANDGSWPASSVNKRRSMNSQTARFMSDAATAFAVLALTENQGSANSRARSTSHYPVLSKSTTYEELPPVLH
jgi:squalene-hopene/tetraprenyl-beta-curcumene cyclase